MTAPRFHAWARSRSGWRPCTPFAHPDTATDRHEARYLAARWLAIDGVLEVIVLPAGEDPNDRPIADYFAHADWRAQVVSPVTASDAMDRRTPDRHPPRTL